MSLYEQSIFKLVRERFWQAFRQERDLTMSFLNGICQVFDLEVSFNVKREGERLKILNVYPEDNGLKKESLIGMDEGLSAIIDEKKGYSCNTTEEGSDLKRLGINSFLVVPLEPLLEGYLFLCNRKRPAQFKEVYTSYDLFLSQALARCITIFPVKDILKEEYFSFLDKTIENIYEQVSKEHRLIKEADKLKIIVELNHKLNSPGELSEVLGRGLEFTLKALHSKTGYILFRDEITQRLKVITAAGEKKEEIMGLELSNGMGIEGWVINENKLKYLNDIDDKSLFNSEIAKASNIKTKSILVSPIRIKTDERRVIGVIVLLNKPIDFTEEDKELLGGISEAIGSSIQSWSFIEERVRGIIGPYLPHLHLLREDSPLHKVRREEASILIADMSGFTLMVERLGREEELPNTLSEYFSQMSEIVFEREGIVDKFIGDAIMAIFWKPENAILAAFDMKNEFDELKKGWENKWKGFISDVIKVDIKCGIATGFVFIGDLGSDERKEYTATGGPVNLAFRLVGEADAGEVWIDAPTSERAKGIITNFSELKQSFRGFTGEQWVYDIMSIKQESPEEIYSNVEKYIEKGLIRRALVNLDRVIRMAKDREDLRLKSFLRKARLLKDIGNYKEAYECYNKVLEKEPNCTEALKGKTECLEKGGIE